MFDYAKPDPDPKTAIKNSSSANTNAEHFSLKCFRVRSKDTR
jgi:hypothetical protein